MAVSPTMETRLDFREGYVLCYPESNQEWNQGDPGSVGAMDAIQWQITQTMICISNKLLSLRLGATFPPNDIDKRFQKCYTT